MVVWTWIGRSLNLEETSWEVGGVVQLYVGLENSEIFCCVDSAGGLTFLKSVSQCLCSCSCSRSGTSLPRVMWTVSPQEELSEAMLLCDLLLSWLSGECAGS